MGFFKKCGNRGVGVIWLVRGVVLFVWGLGLGWLFFGGFVLVVSCLWWVCLVLGVWVLVGSMTVEDRCKEGFVSTCYIIIDVYLLYFIFYYDLSFMLFWRYINLLYYGVLYIT